MKADITIHDFPLPASVLEEWEGVCLELVDALLWNHPEGQLLYVENLPPYFGWRYHAAFVYEGVVYDAWHPDVRLPPAEYVRKVFGPKAKWEIVREGDEIDLGEIDLTATQGSEA